MFTPDPELQKKFLKSKAFHEKSVERFVASSAALEAAEYALELEVVEYLQANAAELLRDPAEAGEVYMLALTPKEHRNNTPGDPIFDALTEGMGEHPYFAYDLSQDTVYGEGQRLLDYSVELPEVIELDVLMDLDVVMSPVLEVQAALMGSPAQFRLRPYRGDVCKVSYFDEGGGCWVKSVINPYHPEENADDAERFESFPELLRSFL